MKTLVLRVKYQNESTLKVAQYLEKHPAVEKVNYPGLESHPDHKKALDLFEGFGGILSFELKNSLEAAESFIRNVNLPACAPSVGGVESLITRPATTSHSDMSPEERLEIGVSDSLIRLSIGIEATEDLIEDFDQALKF